MWRAKILTLFPEMLPGPLGFSLAGKALADCVWSVETVDIRAFATDRHSTVDDTPFGGGPGMVMRPDVVSAALRAETDPALPLVLLSPRGTPLDQKMVRSLAAGPGVTVLCGRYEGIDQRVVDAHAPLEISVGDYVLSGGEIAALVLLDACVRLLPGVMGAPQSQAEESFEQLLLEYPHYTRPARWIGPDGVERSVPEILLSGHHQNVRAWRRAEAERLTRERRPDLWQRHVALSPRQ